MSVIAFSAAHQMIASDSMALDSWSILGAKPKCGVRNGILFGATGVNSSVCRRFLDWCQGGMVDEPPEMEEGGKDSAGFVFPGDDMVVLYTIQGINAVRQRVFAHGTGSDLAIGAMLAGATPLEAVQIAAERDLGTNGPFRSCTRDGVVRTWEQRTQLLEFTR